MAGTPNVGFIRPEVVKKRLTWDLIRDCLAGQEAIKAGGDKYLPRPNASDKSKENQDRFELYLRRAVFYNVAQRTHEGLVGQVFQKEPTLEIPQALMALEDDADGAGVSILHQAKKTLGSTIGYGRCGLLADFPTLEIPASREQLQNGEVRPAIVHYDPWNIINWRTKTVGSRKVLSLVVLYEEAVTKDDGFVFETGPRWRVLRLEPDTGYYSVTIFQQSATNGALYEQVGPMAFPKDSSGNNLRYIPFQFVGAVNNDPEIDNAPLYDLCVLNLAHYRNSADWEEACFIVGQPTPVVTGITEQWNKNVLQGKIRLGSRGLIPLPANADAKLLQAAPNTMPAEGMERKERQMVALGAKLLEQKQVQRTATDARLEFATELSVLGTCASNVAHAYEKALLWCSAFVGPEQESTVEMTVDFELGRLSAQDQAQVVASWQAKALATSEMRTIFKKAGLATLSDDDYKAELDSEPPTSSPGMLGSGVVPPGGTVPQQQQENNPVPGSKQ